MVRLKQDNFLKLAPFADSKMLITGTLIDPSDFSNIFKKMSKIIKCPNIDLKSSDW